MTETKWSGPRPPTDSGIATSVANTGVFLGTGFLQSLAGWMIDRVAQAQNTAARYHLGVLTSLRSRRIRFRC